MTQQLDTSAALEAAIANHLRTVQAIEDGEHVYEWVVVAGLRGTNERSSPLVTTSSRELPMYVAKGLLTHALDVARECDCG